MGKLRERPNLKLRKARPLQFIAAAKNIHSGRYE